MWIEYEHSIWEESLAMKKIPIEIERLLRMHKFFNTTSMAHGECSKHCGNDERNKTKLIGFTKNLENRIT